jgi:hypothetical protein
MSGRLAAMKRATLSRVLTVVCVAVVTTFFGAFGCGLISSDITKVTFDLPMKTYIFDSASFGVPAGNTAAIPCGAAPLVTDCCNPLGVNAGCSPQRSVMCEAAVCTLHQVVSIPQKVDFKKEVPQLASVSDQHLANMSFEALNYAVTANTLNVAVPPLQLYLAPGSVTTLPSDQAVLFGTVDTIPAGQTPSGSIKKEADADATFARFGSDLSAPFNILIGTTIVVPSGTPTPTGRVSVAVTGTFAAKLAL